MDCRGRVAVNVLILRDLWEYQLDDRIPRTEILMDGYPTKVLLDIKNREN